MKIIKLVIAEQFKNNLKVIKEETLRKDSQIEKLNSEVKNLKKHIIDLEAHIDSVKQYERSDTIIINGPELPSETLTRTL